MHDIDDESWNAYGQFTYISSWKPFFPAAYTNVERQQQLVRCRTAERSFTGSFTLFFGLRLWKGGEAYLVPEVISERPLSGLRGIGGAIQNFELQKTGSDDAAALSLAHLPAADLRPRRRAGGEDVRPDAARRPRSTSRRLVFTLGNFTILDVFDRNTVSWDPRQTFLNMAFMTYASWDFPSDARGYSWGGTAELYWDDWALRIGRITPPQNPNSLAIDFRIWKFYGDQLELEHDHGLFGRPGAVRLLGYRNHVDTGSFDDAIAAFQTDPSKNAAACNAAGLYNYGSANMTAPDLCWVRQPNVKLGVGISVEQYVAPDIGLFLRVMYSDGRTEVDAYNPADRSFSLGAVAKGTLWQRPFDVTGAGFGMSWISSAHAAYLAMGGVDGFVGDGRLQQAGEGIVEAFYSFNLLKALWLTADYQHLWNPGFNADRGPVDIYGARIHVEF